MTNVIVMFDTLREFPVHLEDRREYSVDDLIKMYDLSQQEGEDLHWLIKDYFEPNKLLIYKVKNTPSMQDKFVEGIVESFHGSLEGWNDPHDKVVIQRYVEDMLLYVKLALNK